jgi:ParB-like chromosome segregation protein Spo0J
MPESFAEYRDPASLKPYPGNPRNNDAAVDAVAASLREFGFQQAIVVDEDGVIVCGHTRWKAATRLGLKSVPVRVAAGLTPAQVKAYRLADNQTGSIAEWVDAELRREIEELGAMDFDIGSLGFDDERLAELAAEGVGEVVEDEVPEPPVDPITKPGDLWILGEHRVLCGDSTKAEDVARLMGGERAALCLTDPPYGLGDTASSKNNYATHDDTQENLQRLIEKTVMPLIEKMRVVFTPGNVNQHKYPSPTWTMAWFCPAGVGSGPWGFCCWQPIMCYGKDPKLATGQGRHPDALVHQEGPSSDQHPCAKPMKFWAWLMERVSNDGELIYDPFLGSGTTLIAAEQLGRKCFGMEISPQYCDVIVKRWETLTGKKAERQNA